MTYLEFKTEVQKGVNATIRLFDQLEQQSDGTVKKYVDILNAPSQSEGIQLAHKVRNTMMSIKSYTNGVNHLDGHKFESIGKMEYDNLLKLLSKIDAINLSAYKQTYRQLAQILYPD